MRRLNIRHERIDKAGTQSADDAFHFCKTARDSDDPWNASDIVDVDKYFIVCDRIPIAVDIVIIVKDVADDIFRVDFLEHFARKHPLALRRKAARRASQARDKHVKRPPCVVFFRRDPPAGKFPFDKQTVDKAAVDLPAPIFRKIAGKTHRIFCEVCNTRGIKCAQRLVNQLYVRQTTCLLVPDLLV